MLHISTRTLMLFGTGFLTVLCPVVSIEALPGENVAIWCEHNIHVIADLCWFTQASYVVPIKIVCMKYTHSFQSSEAKYFSNFTMNQMIMHLYRKSTSLTILSVRVSDSGFYFCGAAEYQIKFGNGSRLEVKDKNEMSRKNDTETLKNDHDKSSVSDDDDCSGNIFLILTFIFGGFIIFTFNILLILAIIRKHRRQRKAAEHQEQQQDHKEQESDLVEYSAVHLSKKKPKRRERQTDTIVMYEMYTDAT